MSKNQHLSKVEKHWSLICQVFHTVHYRTVALPTWVLKTRLIEKKHPKILFQPNCRKLQDDSKNVSLKIGIRGPKKLGPFFSLFLMRKSLSMCQNWFLRQFLQLIMFLMRSGLSLFFQALQKRRARTESEEKAILVRGCS